MRMSRKNIEKKRANTSVLIRKADAFGAVIEAAAREESENDVLKRIDRIPPVAEANVAFLCDGRKCDSCSGECRHTLDVSHAKNFSKRDGAYFENEELQKDQPVKGLGVFIPGVTVEMIRMAPLEGIEELLNNGEMYNVPKPTEDNRSLPAGDYISRAEAIEAVDRIKSTDNWQGAVIALLSALPLAEHKNCWDCKHYEPKYDVCHAPELVKQVTGKLKNPCDSLLKSDSDECKEQKSKLESAEAVQGEWIRCEGGLKDWEGTIVGYSYWYECDQCGSRPPKDQWGNEWHSEYCPSCGAKMSKGGDSE